MFCANSWIKFNKRITQIFTVASTGNLVTHFSLHVLIKFRYDICLSMKSLKNHSLRIYQKIHWRNRNYMKLISTFAIWTYPRTFSIRAIFLLQLFLMQSVEQLQKSHQHRHLLFCHTKFHFITIDVESCQRIAMNCRWMVLP